MVKPETPQDSREGTRTNQETLQNDRPRTKPMHTTIFEACTPQIYLNFAAKRWILTLRYLASASRPTRGYPGSFPTLRKIPNIQKMSTMKDVLSYEKAGVLDKKCSTGYRRSKVVPTHETEYPHWPHPYPTERAVRAIMPIEAQTRIFIKVFTRFSYCPIPLGCTGILVRAVPGTGTRFYSNRHPQGNVLSAYAEDGRR